MQAIAEDLFTRAQQLTVDEQLSLSERLAQSASAAIVAELNSDEKSAVETTLRDRVNGPFEAFPKDWKEDILKEVAARREDA